MVFRSGRANSAAPNANNISTLDKLVKGLSIGLSCILVVDGRNVLRRVNHTSSGGDAVMTIGAPLDPRFVAAVDPRMSATDTTIVRLYPSRSKPGGMLVLRMVDNDQDEDSWFTSSDSLQNSASHIYLETGAMSGVVGAVG